MEDITTIKIYKDTKDRLEKFRSYRRESYDEIIQKILEILNMVRVTPDRARARLLGIEKKARSESRQKLKDKFSQPAY